MKKLITVLIVAVLLVMPFSIFASADVICQTNLSPPFADQWNRYFIISTDTPQSASRLIYISIPTYLVDISGFTVSLLPSDNDNVGKWTILFQNESSTNTYACNVMIFNAITGQYVSYDTVLLTPRSSHKTKLGAQSSSWNYVYYSPGIYFYNSNNINLLSVNWNSEQSNWNTLSTDLDSIIYALGQLYSNSQTMMIDLASLSSAAGIILSNWAEAFSYMYIYEQKLNLIETYVFDIMNSIIPSETVTYPDNATEESQINDYIDAEDDLFDVYDNNIDNVDILLEGAEVGMSNFSSGFLFIKNLFAQFIPEASLPYFIIFISLSFGLIALILGRRINR